jgi:hypothetical protein
LRRDVEWKDKQAEENTLEWRALKSSHVALR